MKRMKRVTAIVLILAMVTGLIPATTFAYPAEKDGPIRIVDKDGRTVTEEESWEETFPYGTFAFDNSQLTVAEGGAEGVIRLYRLGGTAGRAIAYVTYVPPSVRMADGTVSYANAAGASDVRIRVEDPLPIAAYQPLGKDPEPLEAETPAQIVQSSYAGEDAEEGDAALALDQTAEAYQWQIYFGGAWQDVDSANEAQLIVGAEDAQAYDFRCVYTVDGERYVSASRDGETYVRQEEVVPELPDDFVQDDEITYSELPMDPENPYEGQLFSVVFADGEWVKEIFVSAPDDDTAEPDKFGLFTIEDCLGGSLYDSANTLTLHVADDDEAGESAIGFVVTKLDVDKAQGTAALTVRRTGDTTQVLTVDYATEDGSATCGVDYIAASGSLIFYAGVTEQTICISLIDDGAASDERRELSVVLSGVKGDGDGLCTLTEDRATVSLWNSATGEGTNLATVLVDSAAEDVSGGVPVLGSPAAPVDPGVVSGSQQEPEEVPALEAQIVPEAEGGVTPRTYDYPTGTLVFQRSDYKDYVNHYWVDSVYMAAQGDVGNDSWVNSVGNSGLFGTWSGGKTPNGGKLWAREFWDDGNGSITLPVQDERFEEKFSQISLDFDFTPEWASDWKNFWHEGDEWTYPWFRLYYNDTSRYFDAETRQDGNTIYWYSPRSKTFPAWSMTDDVKSLQLGTSKNDGQASEHDTLSRLKSGELRRRSLQYDLRLRVYTANDEDTHGQAALISKELYARNGGMQPTVTLATGEGGVTWNGKLYVGSRLQVELQTLDSYFPGAGGVNYTVFLTDSSGTVRATGVPQSDKVYTIDLLWDTIDLNDTYTLNVIMTRRQEVKLDITPSVTRLEDNPSAIDPSQIEASWRDRFWASAADASRNYISYGAAVRSNSAPYLDSRTILEQSVTNLYRNGAEGSLGQMENLQWINFNRSPEDYIVFNGRMYAGNETIWLEQKDLGRATLNFSYYHRDFLSATSAMSVKLNGAGLYLDVNCNGRIDGWWNEQLGTFQLDETSGDQFLFRLNADEMYSETVFAPVPVEWDGDGKPTKYAQYFLKVDYSLTPRSLIPGPDADVEHDRAQVLPAFVTSITDPSNYARLTEEQRSYRYLICGKSQVKTEDGVLSGYRRSGDGRPMYGPEASQTATIDIPLGGDTSPAHLNSDGSAYEWEPSYQGNLLYPFESPEPIFIANSLAGENIPVAQIDGFVDGAVTFRPSSAGRSGKELLNGYLGSFTANDTYVLCVQEQTMTTDEIAAANGVAVYHEAGGGGLAFQSAGGAFWPEPESASVSSVKTTPDGEYLKESSAGDDAEADIDMDESGNAFEEFNLDLGVQLPTIDIGATDFATVIMDGNQVGFSIGVPLGGYESGKGGSSPWKSIKESAGNLGKLKHWIRDIHDEEKTVDESYRDATKQGTGKKLSSHGYKIEFSASAAFLFKYSAVDNRYRFHQFALSAAVGFEFKAQHRFSACPIVYLYCTFGVSVEIGTGVTVEREVTLGAEKLTESGELKKGKSLTFSTDKKAFSLEFNGKVLVETFTDSACTQTFTGKGAQSGYLQSDGSDPVTVTLARMGGQDLGKTVYVRLTALEQSNVTSIKPVTGAKNKTYFSGFELSPELFVEAGVGVGVEVCKLEVYLKVSFGVSIVFAQHTNKGVSAFSFEELTFSVGAGVRIAFLMFSIEMDLIQYTVSYEKGKGWKQSWSAVGGMFGDDISTLSARDRQGNTYSVHIRLPGSAAGTQTIYEPEQDAQSGVAPMAIDPPNGRDVPFQLSGYGSSADAFRLADGLISGYDYQVVSANGKNYLIYTISRTGAKHAVDNSMLVLSELRLTSVDGADSYGLVNPLQAGGAEPYVLLDTTAEGQDDGTGDLEFTAWADDGGQIHAAWVSYDAPSDPGQAAVRPDDSVPVPTLPDGTQMDAENYADPSFTPAAPAAFTDPEPLASAYYLTPDDYAALDAAAQGNYVAVTGPSAADPAVQEVIFYSVKDSAGAAAYAALDDAEAAFEAAHSAWQTQKTAYETELADYNAKQAAYALWYRYFLDSAAFAGNVQDILDSASKHTVVKTASFDPASGFSTPVVLSGAAGAHVFLPNVVDSGTAVFGRAVHYTNAEVETLKADYRAYLKAIEIDPNSADDAEAQIGQYRLSYQEGVWDVYGKGTQLCVSVGGDVSAVALSEGQTLDNLEAAKIGDTYYMAYTTSQRQYRKGDQLAASAAEADDLLTIHRLFLRTFTVAEDGTVDWGADGKALLLRTLYDYDVNAACQDGVFAGGGIERYGDPYFANLQFLNAALGALAGGAGEDFAPLDETPEDFLLFEMNGSTYVIPQASLESIAASGHGSIVPFFTPAAIGDVVQSSTGRAEVTIGADGAGGLAAVYVGAIPGTSSNAIYLTRYDPASATWGAGVMLAANHMQVYEDAAAYGLTAEQTEKAFLGQTTGNAAYDAYLNGLDAEGQAHARGSMDFLTFSGLQIALGQKKEPEGGAEALPEDTLFSAARPAQSRDAAPALTAAGRGDKDTLLVITQGTMRYLREITNGDQVTIGPMSDSAAQAKFAAGGLPDSRKPGVGIYAVSYGVGRQQIGEASLVLADCDFSAGTRLSANVSFVNTGDVALRAEQGEGGGKSMELTVELMVSSMNAPLAVWHVTDHVLAGQKVELAGTCAPLTTDLKAGDAFYLVVREGDYFEDGFCFQSGPLLTVDDKVELGFEDCSVETQRVDASGNAVLNTALSVSNRGSRTAGGVFLQFSYEDADGTFVPLDLTGSTLEVSQAKALEDRQLRAISSDADLENGIFRLYSRQDNSDDIPAGYYREVTGAIPVPASCYAESLTGGLNLRIEIFSDADTTKALTAGLLEVEHDEYYTVNNVLTVPVSHATFFTGASKVVLAMGNTMRLPITLSTTTGKTPSIAVVETPKEGEAPHLGVLYYQSGAFSGGGETGTLVMTPVSTGSGIVHLQDLNTNTIYAVAYTVTGAGEGVNIFNDTDVFTFSHYDPDAVGDDLPWKFKSGVPSWGEGADTPLNADLAQGRVGESFSFETQAESIKLYFDGAVTVSSTFPGFGSRTYTAAGGQNGFADIRFGANDTNYAHTVTVTVTKGAGQNSAYASFDRVVLTFGKAGTPVPAADADSPHIYWSRSFPDTASLTTGARVSLRAFVLDNSGLASVTVNGQTPANLIKHSEQYWTVPLTLTENGSLELTATDTSGRRTTHKVEVDWFLPTPIEGASAEAPGLTDVAFETEKPNQSYRIVYTATPSSNAGGAQPGINVTSIIPSQEGLTEGDRGASVAVASNGWYYVKATDSAEGCAGQWSAEMLYMGKIDTQRPTVNITRAAARTQDTDGGADLDWSVWKDVSVSAAVATISEASLNGMTLSIPGAQTWVAGSWHATHAGTYEVQARDTAGNTGFASLELTDIPVYIREGAAFYTIKNADNEDEDNGAVTVEPSVLLGGTYDAAKSAPAAGRYRGSYEWRLVKQEDAAVALAALLSEDGAWTGTKTVFEGLTPGTYTLYVRDANDRRSEESVMALQLTLGVTVGSERIDAALEEKIETSDESGSSIGGSEPGKERTKQSRLLIWSAQKRAGARIPIAAVTINGQTVSAGSGFGLSGETPIHFGGTYRLTADDGSGVTESVSVTAEDVPIVTGNAGALVTIVHPWNADASNGSVTVHLTDEDGGALLTGGLYDAAASDPANGVYVGRYQWRLVPVPEDEPDEPDELLRCDEGWMELTGDSRLENQSAGSYTLFIRDAQEPTNEKTMLTLPVTLKDEYITLRAESLPSVGAQKNGSVTATAGKGYLGLNTYQFILRPIVQEEDASADPRTLDDPLDRTRFPESDFAQPQWDIPNFTQLNDPNEITDISYNLLNTTVFEGLPAGWYQVAARPMMDVTAAELLELARRAAARTAAAEAAEIAAANATETGVRTLIADRTAALAGALEAWRKAGETDREEKWLAYTALIGGDQTVLDALDAWKNDGFGSGAAMQAYHDAVNAYVTAAVKAETAQAAADADTALQTAQAAYDALYQELAERTEAAYAADGEIGWGNAASMTVYVKQTAVATGRIELADLRYPDENTVLVRFSAGARTLSNQAARRLIADNAARDLLAVSPVMNVRIPAGTLHDGDDVMAMLMPFVKLPEDRTGTVVRCTGADGKSHYVPWSAVTQGKVYYIASEVGTYELTTNPVVFADVRAGYWGADSIDFTAARMLFRGVDGKRFDPDRTMTRAMLVTVLGRMAGIDPAGNPARVFADVDPNAWYGSYVAWAAENGIVQGVGGNRFAPEEPVTREQLCTMLARYLKYAGITLPTCAELPEFPDQSQISAWAFESVRQLQASGLVKGDDAGCFRPGGRATRAELSTLLARMITQTLTA